MKNTLKKVLYLIIISILFYFWFPPKEFVDIYSFNYNCIKISVLSVVILVEIIRKRQLRYLFIWLYAILIFVITLIKQSTTLLVCGSHVVSILSIFYFFKNPKNVKNVELFYIPVSLYMLKTVWCMFRVGWVPKKISNTILYFIGGKFGVFYLSILWEFLGLLLIQKKNGNVKKKYIFLYFILVFLINVKVNCMTGVICSTLLTILLLFRDKISRVVDYISVALMTTTLNIFVVFIYPKLNLALLNPLFNKILNRNANLTDRTSIYNDFLMTFNSDILFGKGYKNNFTLEYIGPGAANTQNGFLDNLCAFGIVGASLVAVIIYLSFYFSYDRIRNKEQLYIICWMFLFMFLVSALIEISFNVYFFFILAICFSASKDRTIG